MQDSAPANDAVELLQELGLKEYEARCFLALTQLSTGTAKEISTISTVPRTRVYDATSALEAKGLIEVQHSNPQEFRAVSISEATETLRRQYEDRIATLQSNLQDLGPAPEDESERVQEVWSLSGHDAIGARTRSVVEDADSEVVLVVVDDSLLTDALFRTLEAATDRGVSLVLGGLTQDVRSDLRDRLPGAEVFESELEWLRGEDEHDIAIGRLLLADRSTLLVSTFHAADGTTAETERAIFATGLGNGVVVLIRRVLATGLLSTLDPGPE